MAVKVVQLFLDVAAEATSVVSIQPLPHNTHAILTLMFVKCKVLNLRRDATTQAWVSLVLHYNRSPGHLRYVPPGVWGKPGSLVKREGKEKDTRNR